MASGSGNISNVVQFGGTDSTSNLLIPEANSQGYFSLNMPGGNLSNGNYGPFFKNGVLYQVSSGKTCFVVHITYTNASNGNQMQLVYSMTTFAANASSITSGFYEGGAAGAYVHFVSSAYIPAGFAQPYSFPSLSFPGAQFSIGGGGITLICKEA